VALAARAGLAVHLEITLAAQSHRTAIANLKPCALYGATVEILAIVTRSEAEV
jgi:hypothetical protein